MSSIAAVAARIAAIESRLGTNRRLVGTDPAVGGVAARAAGATTAAGTIVANPPATGRIAIGAGALYGAVAQQTEAAIMTGLMFDPSARATYAGPWPGGPAGVGLPPSGIGRVPIDPAAEVRADVPYSSLFNAAGARYGIPPVVLAGVGYVESRFRLDVVSSAGAQGMMQFLPGTAAEMGVNPWDPVSAVDGAARYLRDALERFGGSLEMAVGAYNIGPGAMARAGGVLPGSQAETYVQAVMQAAGRMS